MGKKPTSHIILPENTFWEVFKRFGRDEVIALLINSMFTGLAAWYMTWQRTPESTYIFVITLIGPIVEKFRFFPAHFWEARREFKAVNKEIRGTFKPYFQRALKRGSKSLIQDILIHDTVYILLMYLGVTIYADTPAWILAVMSFIIAVIVVAGIEVATNELLYLRFRKSLQLKGFDCEKYYEARFLVEKTVDIQTLLYKLQTWFNLKYNVTLGFEDKYYHSRLPSYGNRTPKLRLRKTKADSDVAKKLEGGELQLFHEDTCEIIYTKAAEITHSELSQYRYFPTKKHKFFMSYRDYMAPDVFKKETIMEKFQLDDNPSSKVKFKRHIVYDPKTLLFSVDCSDETHHDSTYYLLEVKVFADVDLLKAAMNYIMYNFPVLQMTHGKSEILKK